MNEQWVVLCHSNTRSQCCFVWIQLNFQAWGLRASWLQLCCGRLNLHCDHSSLSAGVTMVTPASKNESSILRIIFTMFRCVCNLIKTSSTEQRDIPVCREVPLLFCIIVWRHRSCSWVRRSASLLTGQPSEDHNRRRAVCVLIYLPAAVLQMPVCLSVSGWHYNYESG